MQENTNAALDQPLMTPSKKPLDANELLAIVGNDKTYQKRLLLFYLVAQIPYTMIYTAFAYVFTVPTFYCNASGEYKKCAEALACKTPGYYYIVERHSVVSEWGLFCDKAHIRDAAKNTIIVFAAVMCFLMTIVSDRTGRKLLFLLASGLLISGCIMAFGATFEVIVAGVAACMLALYLHSSFAYIYISEVIGANLRSRILPIIQLFGSMGVIASSIISLWVKTYTYIFAINLAVNGTLALMLFYLVETPFMLNKLSNKVPLFNTLSFINGVNYQYEPERREQNEKTLESVIWPDGYKNTLAINTDDSKLLMPVEKQTAGRLRDTIGKIALMALIYLNVSSVAGATSVSMQHIGFKHIQMNMVLVCAAQMAAQLISFKYAPYTPRRKLMITTALATLAVSAIMFVNGKVNGDNWAFKAIDLAVTVAFLGYIGFTATLISTYAAELFPTQYRGLGIGFGNCVGRSAIVLANYYCKLGDRYGLSPLTFTFIPATIMLLSAMQLEETVGGGVKN